MAITDIPLSKKASDEPASEAVTPGVPTATTLPSASTPKDLAEVIQTGKGFLRDDPQSGSILKILMENGFREKIEEGITKGHTYAILHAAPSPDFTLVDTWNETVTDESGQRTQPKKSYQFFRIQDAPSAATIPVIPTTAIPAIAADATPVPIKPADPVVVATEAPVPEQVTFRDTLLASEEALANQPAAIADPDETPTEGSAKKSWLFEKLGMKFTQEVAPRPAELVSPNEPTQPETLEIGKGGSEPTVEQPIPTIPQAVPPMPNPALSTFSSQPPAKPAASLDLLKKKFQTPGGLPDASKKATTVSALKTFDAQAFKPSTPEPILHVPKPPYASVESSGTPPPQVTAEIPLPPQQELPLTKKRLFLESVFGKKFEGIVEQEWEKMKMVPARPFVHPTEYSWGTDTNGNGIDRSLDNYPPLARSLQSRLPFAIEQLREKGFATDTMTLDQALDQIMEQNIL